MKKQSISDWYGKGVVSGRDNVPLPHKAGAVGVGVEGPKRKTPLKKKPVKSTKFPMPKKPLTDKYGRVISRGEFSQREDFRIKKASVPSAVRPLATKKTDKAEIKRRVTYRTGAPNDTYRTKTSNLDLPRGISSRQVNSVTKSVAQKTAGSADAKQRAASTARTKMSTDYVNSKAATAARAKKRATADTRARAADAVRARW